MSSFSYSMQKGNEYAGKFPARHTRERTQTEPGVPPEPVAGIARPLREERRPRIASEGGTFLLFRSSLPLFCSSLFAFSPGKTRGARFFLLFLRPPGESVFFRIKTGTAFRGGRIPERAFPANRFSLFQTHRLQSLPLQTVIQARQNGEKSGERRRQGPLRRPEPFGDRNLSATGAKRRTKRKATKNDKSR